MPMRRRESRARLTPPKQLTMPTPDQEANIPDTFTPDEVAAALKKLLGAGECRSLVVQMRDGSKLSVWEIWSEGATVHLALDHAPAGPIYDPFPDAETLRRFDERDRRGGNAGTSV